MFDLTTGVVIYCGLVAVVYVGLWVYYDRRDQKLLDTARRRTTFHCLRCERLYAASGRVEVAPCPRCGHENGRLRF